MKTLWYPRLMTRKEYEIAIAAFKEALENKKWSMNYDLPEPKPLAQVIDFIEFKNKKQ